MAFLSTALVALALVAGGVSSAGADPTTTATSSGLGSTVPRAPMQLPGLRHLLPGTTTPAAPVVHATLPVGTVVANPTTGRREVVVPDIRHTAVLIGDSQSFADTTWPQLALKDLGYSVSFAGAGGTGFVAANDDGAANYYDSLTEGQWILPHGDPALVVIEGGGNDAGRGASDDEILANANGLILAMKQTYPTSRIVLLGTLSRSTADGGGRRVEVDALLGRLAEQRGLPFVSAGGWLTTYGLAAYLADSVHLGPEGHRLAAGLLVSELTDLGLTAKDTARDPATHLAEPDRPLE